VAAYVDPYTAPYRGTEVLQRGPGAEGVWGEARSPEKPETNANFQLRRGTWETGGGGMYPLPPGYATEYRRACSEWRSNALRDPGSTVS